MAKRRHTESQKGPGIQRALCGAKKTRGPGACSRPAGWGTPHPGRGRCKWHGGRTPSHVKAAQKEELEEAAQTYGLPVEIGHQEALLEEIQRTTGIVRWLEQRIRSRPADDLLKEWTLELELYQIERRHLVKVSRVAHLCGIEEREILLAEQHGALVAEAIRGILEDLKVADHPDVGKVVRRHLSVVRSAA
ncbi:MAG: hypothetical protein GY898_23185 [Proteobacteria bacterium]|nr:hypothetical protein [Pseudomonadota bacterium]